MTKADQQATERKGYACESLEQAKTSITAALVGSCECNTKSPEATYHMAYCRYLKLLHALDKIDAAKEYFEPVMEGNDVGIRDGGEKQ